MHKPKAYSYIRFSTPEQASGDSLRRQLALSEKYALDHGLLFDQTLKLADQGISAFKGTHRIKGALGEFLQLVEKGLIPKDSVLLVENLDRLSREEVLEALSHFTSIIRAGIRVVTLQDGMEYSKKSLNENFGQLLMSIVLMSRAHEESLTKSTRLKAVWDIKREKAQSGEIKLTGICPYWLKLSKNRKYFIVIRGCAEAIKHIYEMKLSGMGNGRIEKEMNRKVGVWQPINGWRVSYITKLLHNNRALIGEYQPHKMIAGKRTPTGVPIKNYFPPILDEDLFYRVQGLIRRNHETKGNAGGRVGKALNLFTHLATCHKCGGPMALVNKGKPPKGALYLQCDRARRGLGCNDKLVRYDKMESLVLEYCKGLDISEIMPENNNVPSDRMNLENRLESINSEGTHLQTQLENILDSIANTSNKELRGVLEERASTLVNVKLSIEKERQDLEQRLILLDEDFTQAGDYLGKVQDLIEHVSTREEQSLVDIRLLLRNQLRKLLSSIKVIQGTGSFVLFFKTNERRGIFLNKDTIEIIDSRPRRYFPIQ